MKRTLLLIAGITIGLFISVPIQAQSADSEIEGLAHVKELIRTNSAQASNEVEQLLKGKNKKNTGLLVAIGQAYLEANDIVEAGNYASQAKRIDSKSAPVYMLEGNIALANKNIGTACQLYEQAIYFDPEYKEAYLKYANVYKAVNPKLAIEKLEQLKTLDPSYLPADKALAEVYYTNNQFDKAAEVYSRFIHSPEATEGDMTKYAFALFLNHEFDKSLQVANMGLKRNPLHPAFNRLAMYNHADLKQYEEGLKAADAFFNHSENPDFAYLDYLYYGHLLNSTKQYDEAIRQYTKAMEVDKTKANLWSEISEAYENKGDYPHAIEIYRKYYQSLPVEKQTADVQLQLGKLYYSQGTTTDSLSITPEERIVALQQADSVFAVIANNIPDNYVGNFWRARTHSAMDPETTSGLAKPYYEAVIAAVADKNEPRYKSVLVECYSYLGYYYLVANKLPESKEYWNKILVVDATNAVAKRALEGMK